MDNSEGVKKVKQFRQYLDGLIKTVESGPGSRQMSLVKTKLQEARHWTGKMLGVLGQQNPYVTGKEMKNRKKENIPKTTDLALTGFKYANAGNPIDQVDQIREWIEVAKKSIRQFSGLIGIDDRKEHPADFTLLDLCKNVLARLMEARMWAGMELSALRD